MGKNLKNRHRKLEPIGNAALSDYEMCKSNGPTTHNDVMECEKKMQKLEQNCVVYLLQFMKPCYTLMYTLLYYVLTNVL